MGRIREPGSIRPVSPKPLPKGLTRAELNSPLEYLLSVVWDETATKERRDRAATVCLPYCHPKLADIAKGVKDQRAEAADTAGIGTPWANDVEFEIRAN